MQPPALPALRWTSPSPTVLAALVAGGGAVAAAGLGWVAATRSPLIAGGLLGALAFAGVALRRPVLALYGVIAVVALLPFGVPPLRLGVAPTLLDLCTALVFLLWVALAATGRMSTRLAGPGAAILAFATVAGAAALLSDAPFRLDGDGRTFFKLLLATLLFVPVLGFASPPGAARRLTAWLLLLCALQALVGLALYFVPRTLSYRALVALGPLGYPTDGSVLRYRPDTEILRATGTAVDPNMLGALLMVGAAIAVPILLAPRPALPRRPLLLVLALLLPCLLLTESRGSWLGLAGALGAVAVLRHRRLLLAGVLLGPLLLLIPAGARFTTHLLSGLQARDRASAMRLGEIENALAIIARHPWFGAGWGDGSQSIELGTILGVSNVHLTIAERSGLPATALYLVTIFVLGATLWPALRRRLRDPADGGLLLGLCAALVATQIAGMLDHHFVRFPHLVALLWLVAGMAVAVALTPEPRRRAQRRGPTP
jgi:O-antigen ligase